MYSHIDYRRMNDSTTDNADNILDYDQHLNHIQNTKYFSKFNYKSGFHQIKMSEPSIP